MSPFFITNDNKYKHPLFKEKLLSTITMRLNRKEKNEA